MQRPKHSKRSRKPKAPQARINDDSQASLVAPKRDLAASFGHTFRFQNSSGATNQPVAVSDLMGLLAVATGATAATALICSMKIKELVIRTPAGAGSSAYSNVQWLGLTYNKPAYISEVALGSAYPTGFTLTSPSWK